MPEPVYLDFAATTPVRPEVREAMLPFLGEGAFGNPSSPHRFGRAARSAVERARSQVAAALGCATDEVVFTSGGTEADNLAILGAVLARRNPGIAGPEPVHLVSSPTEHKAVLGALHEAEQWGARVTLLPVDADGVVSVEALEEVLGLAPPALVSLMWVNNETGTIQPVGEIAARCLDAGVPFHTDAVQALGKVPVDLGGRGGGGALPAAAAASFSAHKIGGPKGVGALIVRRRDAVHPLIHGGGQQRGVRPGTENVAGIVGFATAVELAVRERAALAAACAATREALLAALREAVPDIVMFGGGAERAPHILSVAAPGTDSEAMLMHLDLAGVAAASGSACTTGALEPSHVLDAMGVARELAVAAVRFSFGPGSERADLARVAQAFTKAVTKVRSLRGVLARA